MASDMLAAVILKDPDWSKLPGSTPAPIRELLQRCLRKDPKMRLRDIGDARLAIDEYLAKPDGPAAEEPPADRGRGTIWLFVAALLALALIGLAVVHFREKPVDPAVARYKILPPENARFGNGMAISPDGKRLAFVQTADTRLWMQSLNALDPQPLAGTNGATFPFWSPDSQFIGFFQEGKLRKVEASGGPPQTICDVPNIPIGGSWNSGGVIIFATNVTGLFRVPQSGGQPTPLTTLDASRIEVYQARPWFLPDGKHFLYYSQSNTAEKSGIFVSDLEGAKPRRLVGARQGAAFAPPAAGAENGHLLFLREGTLMALPLRPKTWEPAGDSFPVAEQVGYSISNSFFTVSANGILIYRSGGETGRQRLTWYDRDGKAQGFVGAPGIYLDPTLSPDQQRLAVSATEDSGGAVRDLWLVDVARGVPTRFTFERTNVVSPVWSPDGGQLIYSAPRDGATDLYRKHSGGATAAELLLQSTENKRPNDWSSDGRYLIYTTRNPKTLFDLWLLPDPGSSTPASKPRPWLTSSFNETQGQFCPSGSAPPQWIAYTSDESGKDEVYVQPFSDTGVQGAGKFQISSAGGYQPRWRRDGKELYYLSAEFKLVAVDIVTSPRFEHGAPRQLFATRMNLTTGQARSSFSYVPSADGKRFLIEDRELESGSNPLIVVLHWDAGLKR